MEWILSYKMQNKNLITLSFSGVPSLRLFPFSFLLSVILLSLSLLLLPSLSSSLSFFPFFL